MSDLPVPAKRVSPMSPGAASLEVTMNPKILFVEDDPDIRHLVRTILRLEGYPVLVAASATEMYERLAGQPSAILLDAHLPDADGLDLCRVLKAADPDRPVILLSAPVSPSLERLAREAGADAILSKPFDVDDLTRTVRMALSAEPSVPEPPESSVWGTAPRW